MSDALLPASSQVRLGVTCSVTMGSEKLAIVERIVVMTMILRLPVCAVGVILVCLISALHADGSQVILIQSSTLRVYSAFMILSDTTVNLATMWTRFNVMPRPSGLKLMQQRSPIPVPVPERDMPRLPKIFALRVCRTR